MYCIRLSPFCDIIGCIHCTSMHTCTSSHPTLPRPLSLHFSPRVLFPSHTQNPGYGDQLVVEQLSKDHNTSNDEELRRLAECGLDPTELRRARRLGYQQNTRSIGDYSIKGGYADVESIRSVARKQR